MTVTAESIAWHWSDHWNSHPPGDWDGQHELSARGYGTVYETAGVILSCSCGREARASKDDDNGGAIPLTVLSELARMHADEGAPA